MIFFCYYQVSQEEIWYLNTYIYIKKNKTWLEHVAFSSNQNLHFIVSLKVLMYPLPFGAVCVINGGMVFHRRCFFHLSFLSYPLEICVGHAKFQSYPLIYGDFHLGSYSFDF
jgi:hypothetical protein